jgi:hypothetical protein
MFSIYSPKCWTNFSSWDEKYVRVRMLTSERRFLRAAAKRLLLVSSAKQLLLLSSALRCHVQTIMPCFPGLDGRDTAVRLVRLSQVPVCVLSNCLCKTTNRKGPWAAQSSVLVSSQCRQRHSLAYGACVLLRRRQGLERCTSPPNLFLSLSLSILIGKNQNEPTRTGRE